MRTRAVGTHGEHEHEQSSTHHRGKHRQHGGGRPVLPRQVGRAPARDRHLPDRRAGDARAGAQAVTAVSVDTPTLLHGNGARLTWRRATDSDFTRYDVHRGTTAGFAATDANRIARISSRVTNIFTDDSAKGSTTYYYKVVVVAASGSASSEVAADAARRGHQPAAHPRDSVHRGRHHDRADVLRPRPSRAATTPAGAAPATSTPAATRPRGSCAPCCASTSRTSRRRRRSPRPTSASPTSPAATPTPACARTG